MSQFIDFTAEPVLTADGSILLVRPASDRKKSVYIRYEGDFVGVYGDFVDACERSNKLGVISRLEWDEHDRAGENGSCALCDETHMVKDTLVGWRVTLNEIIQEHYKPYELGDLPQYTSAHLTEV
jgi:hypothetical protein